MDNPTDIANRIAESQWPRVARFKDSLIQESDRGCALIAASFLDAELERLLKKVCVQNKSILDDFFATNGPLGIFSSRIDAAYLLGKIGVSAHRELTLIRKIRNLFGHEFDPISFETPKIADRCRELKWSIRRSPTATSRQNFSSSACSLLALFHASEDETTSIVENAVTFPEGEEKKKIFGETS